MTASKKCALCLRFIAGNNKTKEHIIPNAIGGRKKTTGFICNVCNKKYGGKWDSELAKQLNWLSLVTGITRDDGEPPKQLVQTAEGEKYWLLNDGSFTQEKYSYSEEDVNGALKIRLTAKTTDELRRRLKGVARKYPKFDVEKALSEVKVQTRYVEPTLLESLSLGGPDVGRSLVKTAYAFASDCGVPNDQCEKALEYLLDDSIKTIPFGFSYLSDLVENRPKDKNFHCVSLHGDPKKKRLWSYIEYFCLFRVVVLLSENYSGPFRNEIYSVNPIDGNSADVKITGVISEEEFFLVVDGQGVDYQKYEAAANDVFPMIFQRARERALNRALRDGFEHAKKSLGFKEGGIPPREKIPQFTALAMEKLAPTFATW